MSTNVAPLSWAEWSSAIDVQLRFASAVDGRDWEALERCFAEDVEAVLPLTGAHSDRSSMIARIAEVVDRLDATQHFLSNHQIDRHGDGMQARCYVIATHVRTTVDRELHFTFGGRYDDYIVDQGGPLRIARRQLTVVWRDGDPSILRG